MFSVLVLGGAGVKAGAKLGHVHKLDVAPTIARFLSLEMPSACGRVLTEALQVGSPLAGDEAKSPASGLPAR